MTLSILLVLTPIAFGVLVFFCRNYILRWIVVTTAALAQAGLAIALAVTGGGALPLSIAFDIPFQEYVVPGLEVLLALYFAYKGITKRRALPVLLAAASIAATAVGEQWTGAASVVYQVSIDQVSLLMVLIVGVIGGLIVLYATGYLVEYHKEHPAVKDRRHVFGSVMLIFLGAMHGLVITDDLRLMLLFWEITTWASFVLIGYAQDETSDKSAFRALNLNMLGGLAFALAIILFARGTGSASMTALVSLGGNGGLQVAMMAIGLISIAGLVKSAQMPFTSWLLGAMVAPTPVSALLHSSTMVKAGVFVLLRMAPALSGTVVGYLVTFVGLATFIAGAFAAISARNAKRILALSTVSNLGLIVVCCGLGTPQLAWVAFFLILFHAVAKALLFLSVGSASEGTGSLDVESMGGLITRMPRVALFLIVGIFGMFVAPFGMLISKWAAMEAFIKMHSILSPILISLVALGSSTTVFFWTKWLGIIVQARNPAEAIGADEANVSKRELLSETVIGLLTVAVCLAIPLISTYVVEPYLMNVYGQATGLSRSNGFITVLMVAMIVVIPSLLVLIARKRITKLSPVYMSGRPTSSDLTFSGTAGAKVKLELRSDYFEKFFGEPRTLRVGFWVCFILVLSILGVILL